MSGRWMFWTYHTAEGKPVFQHYRYPREPTTDNPREKGYGYRYQVRKPGWPLRTWEYRKPPGADALLYRLPQTLANPDADLFPTEGERDCLAVVKDGALSTSHHGGAGKFSEAQAKSLRGHRGRILLVADVDPAGAFDVVTRYDRLREYHPVDRLVVLAPPRPFNDARGALEAGRSLSSFREVDVGHVREVAEQPAPGIGTGSGFWTPDEEFYLTDDELRELADLIADAKAGRWPKRARRR